MRLWQDNLEIKLTRKAAAVLGLLVGHAGQLVAKRELFASVWSSTVVSDDALVTCIQELRKALGDDAKQPTLHRHTAPSRVLIVAEVSQASMRQPMSDGRLRRAAAAIAILPFADLSPDRDQDYFCEGLAEELIDALTHVDGLRIAARSSLLPVPGRRR